MRPLAFISGASSGIGKELAYQAASDGYDLFLVARRKDKLDEIAQQCRDDHGVDVITLAADLSKEAEWSAVMTTLRDEKDRLEVVINNAGFGAAGRVIDLEWSRQNDMIQLNITSLVYFSRECAALMVPRGKGYIMNVASTAAFQAGPLMSLYYASKAFVLHFSEGLAEELKSDGVVVSTLCPGPTESEFLEASKMERPIYFKGPIPTSKDVAIWGWKAMKKGRVVAIHSLKNRLLTCSVRLIPRVVIRKITKLLNQSK
ncbi:MAG: SDR family oxidoreductase [Verrucomicrobiota bacterium]